MGAINSAFNQAVGSVAAASAIAKGAKEKKLEQKEQDMSQALLGKEQYSEAEADIKNLQYALTGEKNKWGEAEGDLAILNAKRTGGKGNTKAALDEKKKAKMTEIDAAKRAFEELSDRIEAKKAMKQRAEIMMNKANKWGGIR